MTLTSPRREGPETPNRGHLEEYRQKGQFSSAGAHHDLRRKEESPSRTSWVERPSGSVELVREDELPRLAGLRDHGLPIKEAQKIVSSPQILGDDAGGRT